MKAEQDGKGVAGWLEGMVSRDERTLSELEMVVGFFEEVEEGT